MWNKGVINMETAQGLLNGVYFYNSKVFGLRALDEHVEMDRSQITVVTHVTGGNRRGVHFAGRLCKNNQGGLRMMKIPLKDITHWADPENTRDVVSIYERYLALIPEKGRFYRRASTSKRRKGPAFGNQPLGENTLRTFLRRMFEEAGIDTTGRFITNHSVKASLCTNLWNEGFDDQQISSRSGHRSKALWRYKRMGQSMEHEISDALQPQKPIQAKPKEAAPPASERCS